MEVTRFASHVRISCLIGSFHKGTIPAKIGRARAGCIDKDASR